VVAPETAAHAAGTSALLPMLTLGIPGSPTAAVLLGGLLIWGLQPGAAAVRRAEGFVWGLIASMYLGNLVGLIVVLTTVPWWAAILRIPFAVIAPVIIVICAIGAYTVHSAMFDVMADAGVRRARLPVQEAALPAGAAGAGAGAGRHGRVQLPPVDAAVAGLVGSLMALAIFLLLAGLGLVRRREAGAHLAR
jgi:putative tricarboxylic transport membrane protein